MAFVSKRHKNLTIIVWSDWSIRCRFVIIVVHNFPIFVYWISKSPKMGILSAGKQTICHSFGNTSSIGIVNIYSCKNISGCIFFINGNFLCYCEKIHENIAFLKILQHEFSVASFLLYSIRTFARLLQYVSCIFVALNHIGMNAKYIQCASKC